MSVRRLLALVAGLPADAAVWSPDTGGWSRGDWLAAGVMETTDTWGRVMSQLLGGKPGKLPQPPQIEYPDRPEHTAGGGKRTTDLGELARFISRN